MVDEALDLRIDLFVSEGGLGVAEDQTERQTLFAGRNGLAAIGGDEAQLFQKREPGLEDFLTDAGPGEGFVDNDGQVAFDGGEACQGLNLARRGIAGQKRLQVQLSQGHGLTEFEDRIKRRGGQAEVAQAFSVVNQLGGRAQEGKFSRFDGRGGAQEAFDQFAKDAGHGADGGLVAREGVSGLGLRKKRVQIGQEGEFAGFDNLAIAAQPDGGGFKEAHVAVAYVLIGFATDQETGQKRGAEQGFFFAAFVVDQDRLGVGRNEGLTLLGLDEAESDGFEEPVSCQDMVELTKRGDVALERTGLNGDFAMEADVLIAGQATDFFDQVDFAFEIQTAGGDGAGDGALIVAEDGSQIQSLQQTGHGGGRKVHAEDGFGACGTEGQGSGGGIWWADAEGAAGQTTASQFDDQRGGAAAGTVRGGQIQAALEAITGFAGQFQSAGGAADGEGRKGGGFQENVGGAGVHLAVEAPHDAGQGDRFFGVGDDEHVGGQRVLGAVQSGKGFLGMGAADDDAAAGQAMEIKSVQRLAELEHDVVGYVHDVVDAAQADGFQTPDEPVGAGADADALDQAGDVEGTEIRLQDLDAGQAVDGGGLGKLGRIRRRRQHASLEGGGDLVGQAQVTEAVGAVAGDFHVQHGVAPGQRLLGFDGEAHVGQGGGSLVGGDGLIQVTVEPVQTDFHGLVEVNNPRGAGKPAGGAVRLIDMSEPVNIYGRRSGRGIRPWILIPKVLAVSLTVGGLAAAGMLVWRMGWGSAGDWPTEVARASLIFRRLFVPGIIASLGLGVLLWLQYPWIFLRQRWVQVKLGLIVVGLGSLHVLGRSTMLALKAAVAAGELARAGVLRQRLLGYVAAAMVILVLVVILGRQKLRLGQNWARDYPGEKKAERTGGRDAEAERRT